MKAVMSWLAICFILLAVSLLLKSLNQQEQGIGFCVLLFLVTSAMLIKVCRGSR